jgi:hypothetical protein
MAGYISKQDTNWTVDIPHCVALHMVKSDAIGSRCLMTHGVTFRLRYPAETVLAHIHKIRKDVSIGACVPNVAEKSRGFMRKAFHAFDGTARINT